MHIYFTLLCLIDMKLLAGGKLKENLFNLLLTDCPIPSISSFFLPFPAWIESSDFSDEAEKKERKKAKYLAAAT